MLGSLVIRTGRVLLGILPVLFLLASCTTTDQGLQRAKAIRAVQAAAGAGAALSSCGAQNYYEAERQLKLGERWFLDSKVMDSSAYVYFKKATELAEKAEEEAVFCDK